MLSRRKSTGLVMLAALVAWQLVLSWRTSHPLRPPTNEIRRSPAVGPVGSGNWQPLFSAGLDGWTLRGGGRARCDAESLLLEHDDLRRPGYLVSDLKARDFHARFQCRILEGDSGFLFRSRAQPHDFNDVIGPQVQLNMGKGNSLGGIFELQARGWLCRVDQPLNDRLIESTDWLFVEVEVEGDHLCVRVDGQITVDFHDDPQANPYRDSGFFAWQIHGGSRCRVLVRKAWLRILD